MGKIKSTPKSRKVNKSDPKYDEMRRKNNEAIKKTRAKAKLKQEETQRRISELRAENDELEIQMKDMAHQMSLMKKILEAHQKQQSSFSSHNNKMFKLLEELKDMSNNNEQ